MARDLVRVATDPAVRALLEVLGFGGQPVRRAVLVLDVRDVARIFVERYVTQDEVKRVADVLASGEIREGSIVQEVTDLEVDEMGFVNYGPPG